MKRAVYILFLLITVQTLGQKSFTATVYDAETRSPLAGVQVLFYKNKAHGTCTVSFVHIYSPLYSFSISSWLNTGIAPSRSNSTTPLYSGAKISGGGTQKTSLFSSTA